VSFVFPQESLKIQRKLLDTYLSFELRPCVYGVKKRSIIENAKAHRKGRWLMHLDIKNFFPSVNYKRIENIFLSLGCPDVIAETFTKLTTLDYQLPQGAPTSPMLANLVLHNFDTRILRLCQLRGFKYTRFYDDIVISGKRSPEEIYPKCCTIIKQEGLSFNKDKKDIQTAEKGLVVTGILVKQGELYITPKLRKELYGELRAIQQGEFEGELIKAKRKLRGQIDFLKSIDKNEAEVALQIFKLS